MSLYARIKKMVYDTIHPDTSDSFAAKVFDVIILALIIASVAIVFAVTFDLSPAIMVKLKKAECAIVVVFTVEYMLRLWTADLRYENPEDKDKSCAIRILLPRLRYMKSMMAVVDLLAILPFFLPLILPEGLLGIRALRLMRLLRVFKVAQHLRQCPIGRQARAFRNLTPRKAAGFRAEHPPVVLQGLPVGSLPEC